MVEHLTEDEARRLVERYMESEGPSTSIQAIINSGEVGRLEGFVVRLGKVSDSVFGGEGSFSVKKEEFDSGVEDDLSGLEYEATPYVDRKKKKPENRVRVEFENSPLITKNDIPLRAMVRTPRVSTHDIVRGEIPFKDQVDAHIYHFMKRLMDPWLGSADLDVPDLGNRNIVIAAENLKQIPFENVLPDNQK